MSIDFLATPHPTTNDFLVNAADWVEINCLFKDDGDISQEDLIRALVRASSVPDEKAAELAADVFLEIEDRIHACGHRKNAINSYPFALSADKTVLQTKYRFRGNSNVALLYWFLLIVSRHEMSSQTRVHRHIDPTRVFELLCADVLRAFWGEGGDWSGSLVFGTATRSKDADSTFRKKIANLCKQIGEGNGMRSDAQPPAGGDGQLDVVAWRKFKDGREGNLIGFAQCKTGTHWKDHLDKLQPAKFARKFFQQEFVIEPVRLYMVPVRVNRRQWRDHSDRSGIVLDRCRITQYGYAINPRILKQCRTWVSAALKVQTDTWGRFGEKKK